MSDPVITSVRVAENPENPKLIATLEDGAEQTLFTFDPGETITAKDFVGLTMAAARRRKFYLDMQALKAD